MKPKHLNQQNIQYVIERLAAWSHNYDVGRCVGWSQSRAHQAIQELGREGALEVEALMYFGRGDYDSFPDAYRAIDVKNFNEQGAAIQVVGKGISALEYIAIGLAKMALDEVH